MAGQVMEAPAMHQQVSMLLGQLQASCKTDHHLAMTMTTASSNSAAATTAAEMAYLQQLQTAAAAAEANNSNNNGGARGEQCPRCASHDTKFCYYNNYNTSQPRHFCRACRRYWTLGGSLRNVPIGGSTRKRPRLAHPATLPASRRHPAHVVFGGGAPAATVSPPAPPQGLLGSLFTLSAAPLLEGRGGAGFDLGLGLTMPPGAGELGVQMQGLGLRGGLGGMSPLLWPAGLLDNDHSLDAWKVPGVGAAATGAAMWPEFSAAAPPPQAGGLLHGGAQLM